MDNKPYRPEPEDPDAALARLAAEGRRRIEARGERAPTLTREDAERKQRETNVRVALGAYHGTPLRKASYALFAAAPLSVAAGILGAELGTGLVIGGAVVGTIALVGALACLSAKTLAPIAAVDAERAWAASLPFAVDGYFDLLAESPMIECVLVVDLAWEPAAPRPAPTPDLVQGVVGLWDTGAQVQLRDGGTLEIRSGRLVCGYYDSGMVETVESFGNVAPNGRLASAIHRLVSKVLLPLHQQRAIARVSLRRTGPSRTVRRPG